MTTKDEALDKALNALLWANIEINHWRDDAHGYKPEDQPQIMEAITAIKQVLAQPVARKSSSNESYGDGCGCDYETSNGSGVGFTDGDPNDGY